MFYSTQEDYVWKIYCHAEYNTRLMVGEYIIIIHDDKFGVLTKTLSA